MRLGLSWLFLICTSGACLRADTITINGLITQSTPDGTGPASHTPSLNNIQDQQRFTITLQIPATITGAGLYSPAGSALSFEVPAASASETTFDSISLGVTSNSGVDDFSLSACIADADCFTGNALSANFSVPASELNGTDVAAVGMDQPHPFELLEDDGETDLQGSITAYSGPAISSAVPEPSYFFFAALLLLGMGGSSAFRRS